MRLSLSSNFFKLANFGNPLRVVRPTLIRLKVSKLTYSSDNPSICVALALSKLSSLICKRERFLKIYIIFSLDFSILKQASIYRYFACLNLQSFNKLYPKLLSFQKSRKGTIILIYLPRLHHTQQRLWVQCLCGRDYKLINNIIWRRLKIS